MGVLGGSWRGVWGGTRLGSVYGTTRRVLCLGLVPQGRGLRRDPRAALRAWGVRSPRMGTSLKARDGSPAQGCRRCGSDEAVCESQTRPEERECRPRPPVAPCRKGLAPRSAPAGWGLRAAPRPLLSDDPRNGGGRAPGPTDGHIAAGDCHTPASPSHKQRPQKKRERFSRFLAAQGPGTAPEAPGARCARRRL